MSMIYDLEKSGGITCKQLECPVCGGQYWTHHLGNCFNDSDVQEYDCAAPIDFRVDAYDFRYTIFWLHERFTGAKVWYLLAENFPKYEASIHEINDLPAVLMELKKEVHYYALAMSKRHNEAEHNLEVIQQKIEAMGS